MSQSLAICLLAYLREAGAIYPSQIFSTKVSEEAMETARAGLYEKCCRTSVAGQSML